MKGIIQKSLLLGIAAMIQGLAMGVFLFPHFIPSGGAAGISVLFQYLWHVPNGLTLWTVNVFMLVAAIKWLGISRALWTVYCVTVTSITIDGIATIMHGPSSYLIVDLFLGAIVFGFGVGILFRNGASSGGMDILALIISKWKGYKTGVVLFWINAFLLLLTSVVVDERIIFYALSSQWISTRVIDFVNQFQIRRIRKA